MDVAELAEAFKDPSVLQSTNHAQLIQRVQELMGQGIDVSSLFATIVSVRVALLNICPPPARHNNNKLRFHILIRDDILLLFFFY